MSETVPTAVTRLHVGEDKEVSRLESTSWRSHSCSWILDSWKFRVASWAVGCWSLFLSTVLSLQVETDRVLLSNYHVKLLFCERRWFYWCIWLLHWEYWSQSFSGRASVGALSKTTQSSLEQLLLLQLFVFWHSDKLWCQPISSPPAAALGLKWMQMIGQKSFNGFLLSCVHVWLAEETVSQRAVVVLVLKLWAWNTTLPAGPMMVCWPGESWGTSWSRERSWNCFLLPLLCRWLMWNAKLFCALSNKLNHTLDSWAWLGLRGYLFKDLEGFNSACRKSHVNESEACEVVFGLLR